MKNTESSSKKNSRYEIRLAGSGGQGIILAGIMLAEAAILDGSYVAQSQNYGPEARGGSSVAEIVVSDSEIDFPHATELDILVALTQDACDKNVPDLKSEGLLIVDSDLVTRVLWRRTARLPLREIARAVGEERAINMAALGALSRFCPYISRESLLKVMQDRLPPTKIAANLQAFEEARKAARSLRGSLRSAGSRDEFEL